MGKADPQNTARKNTHRPYLVLIDGHATEFWIVASQTQGWVSQGQPDCLRTERIVESGI